MNKVILIGRLARDPDVRYSQGEKPMAVSRYTLAVDRKFKRDGAEQTADFISIISFGKQGEFIEKYARKGTKLVITGHIQTGSYTNKDGNKVYTTDVISEDIEFGESKKSAQESGNYSAPSEPHTDSDGFMSVPDEIDDELPFS